MDFGSYLGKPFDGFPWEKMVRSVPVLFEFYSVTKAMTLFLNSEHVNIKFPFQNKSIAAKLALFEIYISKNDKYFCSTIYCKKNSVS